jgi:hypothetical protein
MATILIKKRDTTGAPGTGDLTNASGGAELAVNTADKRLYAKNSSNAIVEIGTNPATLSVNGAYSFPTSDGTANQVLATNGSGTLSFTSAAAGDVVGPASSTDNAVVRFDSTTGKLIKNSTVIMDNSGNTSFGDAFVQRATLKDYAVKGSAIGATGATATIDLENANFFSATLDQACDFTFSNPPGSGDFGAFVLELTNGGAFAITWPAAVDWPGGTAPTLTAAGVDQLVFTTRDAGTTWLGFVAGLDIKSP